MGTISNWTSKGLVNKNTNSLQFPSTLKGIKD